MSYLSSGFNADGYSHLLVGKVRGKEIQQLAQCQVEQYKVSMVASDSKMTFSAVETLSMK